MPKIVYTQGKGLIQSSSDSARFAVPASGSDAPALTGDGTATISGTDVSGVIDVSGQLTAAESFTVTFDTAYDAIPAVVLGLLPNLALTEITAASFTCTASDATGTGQIGYLVIASS